MAEEAPKTTTIQEPSVQVEEVMGSHVSLPEKTATVPPVSETETELEKNEKPLKPVQEAIPVVEIEVPKPSIGGDNDDKIPETGLFKEESAKLSDLSETEKKALQELKQLIQEALNKHEFSAATVNPPPPPSKEEKPATVTADKEEDKKQTLEEHFSKPVTDEEPPQPTKTEEKIEKAGETEKKIAEIEKTEEVEEKIEKTEEAGEGKEVAATEVKQTEVAVTPEKVEENVAALSVDDDGAKTVEAIEETVVSVSSSVPAEESIAAIPSAETESKETKDEALPILPPKEVSIWGIPLLGDERSDVILSKFLRARDFKVKDAFSMIKNTIHWRKEFKIDELVEENLGDDDLEKVVYMHGFDKEGHPVCYNIYGEFQNKELYKKAFSDEEKRQKFLRWRIRILENSIRKLDFTSGGICTIFQVNDLKNSPGPGKWELRQATKQALQLLQDNYPEFVAKQVFINVPWWYLAVNRMISPFLTQRTKSKFVFAGPSKSAETLLRYIAPEQIPVKYGGLSNDGEFRINDAVTEITVKPAAKHAVEFPVTENCLLSWELRVIGWEVSYGAEFVPISEEGYTVIIQKTRKVAASEEPVLCYSYKIGEPGRVVLTIDNPSSKKKKLLYRLKTKPSPSD